MMRRRWWGVMGSVAAAGVLVAAPGGAATPVAGPVVAAAEHSVVGDGPNAVGLVVDTGERVVEVCVRFSESTLTGAEVLRRAGVDPVFAAMGPGLAVCALCGKGCPGDGSCLTCKQPEYWSYWNADPGAAGYRYASLGASNTRLRPGAVDGWRWGTGETSPPFVTFQTLCPGIEVAGTPGTPLPTTLASAPTTTVTPAPTTSPGAAPSVASVVTSASLPSARAPSPPAEGPASPAPSAPASVPAEDEPSTVASTVRPAGSQATPAPATAPVTTAGDGLRSADQAAGAQLADGESGQGAVAATLAGAAVLMAALGGVATVAWRRQRR